MIINKKKKIEKTSSEFTNRMFNNIGHVLSLEDFTLNDYRILIKEYDKNSQMQILEKLFNERLNELHKNVLYEFYKEYKNKANMIIQYYSKNDGDEKYLKEIVLKGCQISDDIINQLLNKKSIDLPISISYIIDNYLISNYDDSKIEDIIICMIVYITSIERCYSWDI